MSQDVDQIVIGANGSIHVAPVGTAAPADEGAAYGVAWLELGLTSEAGVTLSDARTLKDIPAWQLFYPARKIITARAFMAKFVLRQWSVDTVPLAFGGGDVTEPTPGHYKYTPPPPETVDLRALGIDWIDGAKNYRLIIPTGLVSDNVDSKIARSDAADLPIGFSVVGNNAGDDPWYLLTDDPAFEAA